MKKDPTDDVTRPAAEILDLILNYGLAALPESEASLGQYLLLLKAAAAAEGREMAGHDRV